MKEIVAEERKKQQSIPAHEEAQTFFRL